MSRGDRVQPTGVSGEVPSETDAGNLRLAEGMPAEVEGLVEAYVDFACGAKRRHVPDQAGGGLERPGVQRADLAALQGGTIRRAELVQIPKPGILDEVLGVPQQIDDRDDADAGATRGRDQALKVAVGVGIRPGEAG